MDIFDFALEVLVCQVHGFLGWASLPAGPPPQQKNKWSGFYLSLCFAVIVLVLFCFFYTLQILCLNSVEVVSLRMGAGGTPPPPPPRCWWLSGSVRLSRLVQVGR